MPDENVARVQEAYEAFGRGDLPGLLALFDPDIVWVSPEGTPWGGTRTGHDEVAGFFATLIGAVDSVEVRPTRTDPAGPDRVLVVGVDRYVIHGRPVEVEFAHVIELRGGLFVRFQEYSDAAPVTALLETVAAG